MDKEDAVHIHNEWYYSAMKNKEILPFETAWINLEDIMLSERSQTQKDQHGVISLTGGI